VASDAHKPEDYEIFKKAYDIVKNWAGKEYSDKIFTHNQKVIIALLFCHTAKLQKQFLLFMFSV